MTPEHGALLRTKHAPSLSTGTPSSERSWSRGPPRPSSSNVETTPVHDPEVGLGHTWAAQALRIDNTIRAPCQQSRDVLRATRPRKEQAEPGISEQPPVRRLGELACGSRGAQDGS